MPAVVSAEIQSSPAGCRSWRMRAVVTMPRSPTKATRDAEAAADLFDLVGHGGGIGGVAGEHLNGDGAAVGCAEETEDHLLAVLFAVAAVAELGEGAAAALEVAGGDVVEEGGAALEVAVCEALLDPGLALPEPVEHVEDLVAVDGPEAEEGSEAGVGGLGGEAACGGEFGVGSEGACGNGGECQVAVAAGGAVEDAREAELSAPQDGGDMAESAADGDGGFEVGESDAAADDGADAVDECGGQFGEVGDGGEAAILPLRFERLRADAGLGC